MNIFKKNTEKHTEKLSCSCQNKKKKIHFQNY